VRMGEPETIEHNRDKGLGVTVYFGERPNARRGNASTSDFSAAAVKSAVEAAAAIAQGAARIRMSKMKIPVFLMYEQGIFNQVVEALLPEAPHDFRRKIVETLNSPVRREMEEAATKPPPAPPPPTPN